MAGWASGLAGWASSLAGLQGWPAGPKAWPAGPQAWLDDSEGGGQMYVWTDVKMENLPILPDFIPYWGRCEDRCTWARSQGRKVNLIYILLYWNQSLFRIVLGV